MKTPFFVGLVIAIIAHMIGFLLNDWNITLKITEVIVIGCFLMGGALNGTFISGDRFRANYLSETESDRNKRIKSSNYLLILSIPSLIISIILVALKYCN